MAGGLAEESADGEAGAVEVPGLAELLGQLDQQQQEDDSQRKIVLDKDAIDEEAASYSVDQLLLRAGADVARAVALFGPGIVALPLFGHIAGVEDSQCLAYDEHPARTANGVLDRLDLETKFGSVDPKTLMEELRGGERKLSERLQRMKSEDIRKDVLLLQEWRRKANGRMRTLTRRAAWAVLGIPYTKDEAAIRKAFKRKALEMHPDKGGNAERFQLLQEMRDSLILPERRAVEDEVEDDAEDNAGKEGGKGKAEGGEGGAGGPAPEGGPGAEEGGPPGRPNFEEDLEELEKMFRRASQEDAEPDDPLGEDAKNPDRPKLEAARKKIHLSLVDAWRRSTELAAELHGAGPSAGSGGAVRALRRFVERFAATELRQLEEGDVRKAERIFRRFLEQGSEVLCAAAALEPDAAVAEVATKVNAHLLLAARGKPELAGRCARLLEALRSLPQTFERFVAPVELQLAAGAEAGAVPERTEAEPGAAPETAARGGAPSAEVVAAQEADIPGATGASRTGGAQDDQAFLDGLLASATKAAEAALGGQRGSQPPQTDSKDTKMEEERRRRFAEEKRQEEEARRLAAEARRKAQEERERREAEEDEAKRAQAEVTSRDLAVSRDEEDSPRAVQRVRTEWEVCWEHSCAGAKRDDGSAVFCEPCDCWVTVPPFDHTAFELHCEKAGHTDWID